MSSVFASLPVNPFEADVIREPREVTYSVQGLNDSPLNHLIAEFGHLTTGDLPRDPIPSPKAQLVVSPEAGHKLRMIPPAYVKPRSATRMMGAMTNAFAGRWGGRRSGLCQ
jgi:hypothetical protein